ncbi:Clavaminate synthase-like protein [Ophiobolus disseminans]|uniref:Clavaminate synthase-like protein n=1 Tax=Ophiobolus disseminans TaxID=1469910 RepID=A0A6A6ZP09_9PLEO|nr:Clavaminate synthase-like protein [Ophiobolus disseminans]
MPPSDFTSIPIIDLSKAQNGNTREELLEDLRHAIINVGFLYISNHSVPSAVTKSLVDALPVLFGFSEHEKEEVALGKSPHFLGYSATGAEMTAGHADLREQFEFATELESGWREGQPLFEKLRGPNQWPSTYPALRPIVQTYISELTQLSEKFLAFAAEALSLPLETFTPFISDQHRLKLVHYPASQCGATQGVGPHKDSSGWWTFLLQASPPHIKGLQALNKHGDWIDVPNIPGTFVVNIGQGFEVVTNGVCKATTHRVLSGADERYSVPFFQGMRRDLTKEIAVGTLKEHFGSAAFVGSHESDVGRDIDSAFLKGKYDTWGDTQLRTKIRSHQDVGKRFYGEVFEKYVSDA